MKKIVLFLLIVFVSFSCSKECWETSGEDVFETRQLDGFNQIIVDNDFTIHLVQDSLFFIEIRSKENLMSNIKTEVDDYKLTISDQNSCNLMKDYYKNEVYIHCPDLNQITAKETINIYSKDTLKLDELVLIVRGDMITWDFKVNTKLLRIELHSVVGEMKITGEVDQLYFYTSGRNHCFLKDLICQKAEINHSSMGDYHLTVKKRFYIGIKKSGDFYCYGDPVHKSYKIDKTARGQIYFVD